MKIGFDITMLVYTGSGVATYTYNIVKNLLLKDKYNEYHLFYSSFRRPHNFYYLEELKNLGAHLHSWRFPPSLLKLFWGKLHLIPIEWFTGKMDCFHTSDFLRPPLLKGTIGITTVHDLTWKIYPQWHTSNVISAHCLKLDKTIKFKDIIICPSEHTKKDLLRLYPESSNNRIEVIYEGVDEKFKPITDKQLITKTLARYHIKKPYLIYIGAIEPRKNLKRLIKAYDILIKDNKYQNYKLVIGGRAGWKNDDIFTLVNKLNLKSRVIFTGFVEDQDLPILYSAAQCCCYVSLYEGFGLPPLEAQACGCPVVASNSSSIPEILKNSCVYVNPLKTISIENGIVFALKNRANLSSLSISNSAYFTWEKTAKTLLLTIFIPQ